MMTGTTSKGPQTHLWIKDIKENDQVLDFYLVREKKVGVTRNGTPFLSMTLADRTGYLEAKVWERADLFNPLFSEGDVLQVEGYASAYRNEIQLILTNLKVVKEVEDMGLFLESTPRNITEMVKSLKEILSTLENRHLKGLVDRFLSDREFLSLFKQAPAAKGFHHAYLGGLLEHTLSVCQLSRAVLDHYEDMDGELLLTGAFLHDVGKIHELHFDRKIDYTGQGRLLGHLMLGVTMLEDKLSGMKGFPKELALKLKHMVLSHHGEYAFGSPKRPKFREALALHLIDDLDAKMNGLARILERDRQEGAWTDFSRLFDRFFLKGRIEEDSLEKRDEESPREDKQKVLFSLE